MTDRAAATFALHWVAAWAGLSLLGGAAWARVVRRVRRTVGRGGS